MNLNTWLVHGPARPLSPLVLDSPHSGRGLPDDFGAALPDDALRDGEDCFIDAMWLPAAARGIPLLAAQVARTYLDINRHPGDVDLALVEGGQWPDGHQPSGKGALGKALVWRLLDDGRPIYNRLLSVAELRQRIVRCHTPYHAALRGLMDAAHAGFGVVYHLNCHSMNPVAGPMGVGGAGAVRPDVVLGDRDGSSCDPAFTAFVQRTLQARGYQVAVNDPYKGVELVRAHSHPAAGRHSLQIELNKRLYMDTASLQPHDGFARVQADMMGLLDAVAHRHASGGLSAS